jgi:hypothetical protein
VVMFLSIYSNELKIYVHTNPVHGCLYQLYSCLPKIGSKQCLQHKWIDCALVRQCTIIQCYKK